MTDLARRQPLFELYVYSQSAITNDFAVSNRSSVHDLPLNAPAKYTPMVTIFEGSCFH